MKQNLSIGAEAPSFSCKSANGIVSLNQFLGKNVVIYFYPKDMTPGCTIEAQEFRDLQSEFTKKNTVIIGVSKDSIGAHEKFIQKENLKFILLSDEDSEICKMYDTWKEKSMFGKKYMGINRDTFLIDENLKIKKIWRKVSSKGHAKSVLESIA